MEPDDLGRALGAGDAGAGVAAYRERVRAFLDTQVFPLVGTAERERRFPRQAIAALGRSGLLRERWSGGPHGDLGRAVLLAYEIGRAGLGGVGVGLCLHAEAAVPALWQFARTGYAREILRKAIDGEIVCCVATTEQMAGSDLSAVTTELKRDGGEWLVQGTKWFVSPGAAADILLVLCRAEKGPAIALVPRHRTEIVKRLETAGMAGLETVRLMIDARVPGDAILVPPGRGLWALASALFHERLAAAAQALGTAGLALALAVTHLRRRTQFGQPLHSHQALRLRLAELTAQVRIAERGLYATVAEMSAAGAADLAAAAGLKVTAVRLSEHVVSECLHVFGGRGFLEDETPFARLWRDVPAGRIGGGTDEVMWEIVANDMRADDALYDRWITG
jgi:alkylation response protein AidB-like acyl-CoA dehydrogenase